MSDTVIKVENLGKKYVIGHQKQEKYTALRDVISNGVKSIFNSKGKDQNAQEEFWALNDVSFEIKQGDRVGIIGRNGAGKSTLLKVLSRITEPTKGRIKIKGRVASLLEVGTGFHPELTGRENIFLNGVILGMSKVEIKRKFDEIVNFAEVEKFLDTPVKRYSSGMYVRLAFAVAAHLESEILIVDEVLAVGDSAFQKKCLGKMKDVGKEGRTVLFVSHNMTSIENLCSRAIYLKSGKINFSSSPEKIIEKYLSDTRYLQKNVSLKNRKDREGSGRVIITNFLVLNELGEKQDFLKSGKDYCFVIEYEKKCDSKKMKDVIGSIAFTNIKGDIILLLRSNFTDNNLILENDFGKIFCQIKDLNLTTGVYGCMLFLSYRETEVLDFIEYAREIVVENGDYFGTGNIGMPSHCKVLTRAEWKIGV